LVVYINFRALEIVAWSSTHCAIFLCVDSHVNRQQFLFTDAVLEKTVQILRRCRPSAGASFKQLLLHMQR